MDRKIQAAFEQLRNDNQYIWKQSLQLAEKEFSQKGVGDTMDFLPKLLMSKEDLKRQVNTLLHDDTENPRPKILPGPPTNKVLFEGPLPPKEALDAEKQPLPTTPKNDANQKTGSPLKSDGSAGMQAPGSPERDQDNFEDASVKSPD